MSGKTIVEQELRGKADRDKAKFFPKFFKAGPGEYAEGDKFLGVTVPLQRQVARQFYKTLSLKELTGLLKSPWHEERLTALFMLVLKYQKGDEPAKRFIVDFYLSNTRYVNNWDLVDSSAPYILGNRLLGRDRSVLYELVQSSTLWERRIAMVSTLELIRHSQFSDALALAEELLGDNHDLIHKAVGWCLREVGKKDQEALTAFLDKHAPHMPRTALRYSIERLTEQQRNHYLKLR